MVTKAITATNSFPVRVWGMDVNDKPFVQQVQARNFTKQAAELQGSLDVKPGETLGVQYLNHKMRVRVMWVGEQFTDLAGLVGVECAEGDGKWAHPFTEMVEECHKVTPGAVLAAKQQERRKSHRFRTRGVAELRPEGSVMPVHADVADISVDG